VAEAGGQLAGGQGAAPEASRHAQPQEAQARRWQGPVIPEAVLEPDGGNRSLLVAAGSGRLPVHQLLERTGFLQELMIVSALDDLSFPDHLDAIGVADRGQAVGDNHAGDAPELAGDAFGDDGLSQVVECAGGLVEHQDARAADLAEVQGRQLATIVGDRAGIRGFESEREPHDCGVPRAGGTDDGLEATESSLKTGRESWHKAPRTIFHNFSCEKSENSALHDGRCRESFLQLHRMRAFRCHAKVPSCFQDGAG